MPLLFSPVYSPTCLCHRLLGLLPLLPSPASLFIYSSCKGEPFPPHSGGAFHTLLQAFPSPSTLGEVALHPPSLTSLFIYSLCEGVPPPSHSLELRALCPLCYVSFVRLFVIQFGFFFSFFPGWGSVCPRGNADLA
jgi:hypothetical protein